MPDATPRPPPDDPVVTVVVPTCNRRELIGRCLEALRRQGYGPFEIVIVDDGSTDDTPALLEQFAAEHPEPVLRWLVNERNLGANVTGSSGS